MSSKPQEKKPKSSSTRSTDAVVLARVSEVQSWILEGYTRHKILQFGSKWSVSDRQIDDYIAKATELIREINHATLEDSLALIVSNYWSLYKEAGSDVGLKASILEKIGKFRGLDKKTLVVKDERELEEVSDDELDEILEGIGDDPQSEI